MGRLETLAGSLGADTSSSLPVAAADTLHTARRVISGKQEYTVEPARVRLAARLRLEPIGLGHARNLWRLFQDPAVSEWYGVRTRETAQCEAARIAEACEHLQPCASGWPTTA
jgi:hypothetical protein